MKHRAIPSSLAGSAAVLLLLLSVYAGSRRLTRFDPALAGYLAATAFALFAVVFRFTLFLLRPPTWLYIRRALSLLGQPRRLVANAVLVAQSLAVGFVAQPFIWKRSPLRGLAHGLTMWGTLIAFAITFSLVFGWVTLETVPTDLDRYRLFVFGWPTVSFHVEGVVAFAFFHALAFSAVLVTVGVALAAWRRLTDPSMRGRSRAEDWAPLLLLAAVSVTGLSLTFSAQALDGAGHGTLALVHAVTVVALLVSIPFGKLMHVLGRSVHVAVAAYKVLNKESGRQPCARCGLTFASKLQVQDVIDTTRAIGHDPTLTGGKAPHLQHVCPRCRRKLFTLAARAWARGVRGEPDASPR